LGRKRVLEAVAELLSLEPLLHSIEDIAQDPCKLWSRRGRLLFHSDYTRRSLEDLGGRSIALEQEP